MSRAKMLVAAAVVAGCGAKATGDGPAGGQEVPAARQVAVEGDEPLFYYEPATGGTGGDWHVRNEVPRGHRVEVTPGIIDTRQGHPALAASVRIERYHPRDRGPWIVQLRPEAGAAEWSQVVELAEGGDAHDSLDDNARIVRMRPARAERVRALPFVQWVGLLQPAYRMDLSRVPREGVVGVRIDLFEDAGAGRRDAVVALLTRWGAEIVDAGGRTVTLRLDAESIPAVARISDVRWIEPWDPARVP